jgi:hypothetical protein
MRTAICPTQLHFHDLTSHFLGLSSNDRLLRFGSAMTDAWIVAYVESLFESADSFFVVVEPSRDIDSLRSQWNEAPPAASLPDLTEAIVS